MSCYNILHTASIREFDALVDRWDHLWQRSQVVTPMSRAIFVKQWVEQFAPGGQFHCLAVEQDDRVVAAMPFVGARHGRE